MAKITVKQQKQLEYFKNLIFAGNFDEAEKEIEKYKEEYLEKKRYCDQAPVYWLLLLISRKVCDNDELIAQKQDISKDVNYKMAISYSTGIEKDVYENISRQILGEPLIQIDEEELVKFWENWLKATTSAPGKKKTTTTTATQENKENEEEKPIITSQITESISNVEVDDNKKQSIKISFIQEPLKPQESIVINGDIKIVDLADNAIIRELEHVFPDIFDEKDVKEDDKEGQENIIENIKNDIVSSDINNDNQLQEAQEDIIEEKQEKQEEKTDIKEDYKNTDEETIIEDIEENIDDDKKTNLEDLLNIDDNNIDNSVGYDENGFKILNDVLLGYNGKDKNVVVPDNVKVIGKYAFSDCTFIEKIDLPQNLEKIEKFAFENCVSLKQFYIPTSVKVIKEYAFSCCENIEEINIPDIDVIEKNTFENCFKLKQIILPETLKIIGDLAFFGCRKIKNVKIPASVEEIGRKAFASCISLESVNLAKNNSLNLVHEDVFVNCNRFVNIFIEDLESWCKINYVAKSENEFFRYMDMNLCLNEKPIEDLEIPDGIIEISANAFLGYEKLKSLKIPSSVRSIETKAFAYCVSLKNVIFDLEGDLEGISDYAFYKCKSLTEINLPSNTFEIVDRAFMECVNLKKVLIGRDTTYYSNSFPKDCEIIDKD